MSGDRSGNNQAGWRKHPLRTRVLRAGEWISDFVLSGGV
jgi:hypothetical protein